MYLVGFSVVYGLLIYKKRHSRHLGVTSFVVSLSLGHQPVVIEKKDKRLPIDDLEEIILDYLLMAFFSALVGGRLGYVLFYNAQYYFANPLAIISPYDFQSGEYVGLFGMSYHGALIGIVIGSCIFLKKKNINFLDWTDFVIPAAALGYFFGRIGNFLNGELYGRITNSPMGMYFSMDPKHLRHPSQLYEALLEGILLSVILWKMRDRKMRRGILFATYLVGYGLLRMFIEQYRQPDVQLGFFGNFFTMGQILSFVMVLVGLFLLVPKNEK